MKKHILIFISCLLLIFPFHFNVNAATVKEGATDNSSCETYATRKACDDQVMQVGSYGSFQYPHTGDIFSWVIFKVNKVDAAGDRVWCNQLGNWIPAYPLTKTTSSGSRTENQVFKVGDYFIFDHGSSYKYDHIFKIYGVDAPTDSVLIKIKKNSSTYVSTWVYAKPMLEHCL
ncbi:hypothetical protein MKC91_08630 [[Clostridium] innocuum]|jgi:hypothetical protein|nr:hypothetical protein [Erysipelotrichaceae bacterium]MCR0382885.1 hypothetical protein [[Clostridium] innocuum]MCR0412842.1 hypothetical protein [[Clostridium] innocuum]MCR0533992.1 hypothetical protein [[Clostridium] innocuum]MCR0538462.1 hypothetical protein [[Clostridium] innocuum]